MNRNTTSLIISLGLILATHTATAADDSRAVNITSTLASVTVEHQGDAMVIEREQDPDNVVNATFAKTSRPCPPFCIQPMRLAPGVKTLGELEVLDYLQAIAEGDDKVLVIDSRGPGDYATGTIPGAVNLPWQRLSPGRNSVEGIAKILTGQFGAKLDEGLWDFSGAKTLVMFCNGMWCGQSPANIKALLRMGYPADKIKWYRGGMQNWENLGLTTAWE